MALQQAERTQMRKTIYWLLATAALVGGVVFIFGDDAYRAARTLIVRAEPNLTTVQLKIFNDADQDGERDVLAPEEHLLSYVEVTLSGESQLQGVTGASGELVLANVRPGDYTVSATMQGNAILVEPDSLKIETNGTAFAELAAQNDTTLSSIEGSLVLDTDQDSEATPQSDQTVAGVEIQLLLNGTMVYQTSTDDEGRFSFLGIEPDTYTAVPILSTVQQQEFNVDSVPRAVITVRSSLDVVHQELLIRTR